MLTFEGATKLIDFGIAKARGSLSTTQIGRVKGSTAYMSPEQLRGEELTGRSDLFAAGVVLYELITGTRPFRAADDFATANRVLNENPPPPVERVPSLPPQLSAVAMRAMAKAPDDRFESGREMARAIEAALGTALFDEEDAARWLQKHFADAIEKTRAILALAGEHDGERLHQAAASLHDAAAGSAEPKANRRATQDDVPTATGKKLAPAVVLVVDDSRVGRMLVETMLAADGQRVVGISSGEEALESLTQLKPDLIILDINMPGMDGFTVCARLRARPELQRTPVMFLSSSCSLVERQRGLEVGGDDFLRKPFEGPELALRVRQLLKRAAAQG
jgi:PleD family two-component response regulator